MRLSFIRYFSKSLNNFLEAIGNICIFFPYFFSANALLKTLFVPWKNLVAKKTSAGFSFNELLTRLIFNAISVFIGLCMRLSIMLFYLLLQILFILSLPFISIVYILSIPLSYILYAGQKTEDEKKRILEAEFISTHCLHELNKPIVKQWFEVYYQKHIRKKVWWKLSNLMSLPPLARDWAAGFTPILDAYSEDLTSPDYQIQREHMIDRQKEISLIENELSKSEEANVIIVGEEGVGKHTIIDALSKKLYEGKTNGILVYKRILKLNMEKILNEHTDQHQRENFFDDLLREANEAKNIVLLIENMEKYVSSSQGKIDLTVPIGKFAKHSSTQIIGITNPFLYEKFIHCNDVIKRLFTKIDVFEISRHDAEEILLDAVYLYEKKYQVHIPYEIVKNVIEKSDHYITEIPFPEKAVHLLDSTCQYTSTLKESQVKIEHTDTVLNGITHIPITLSDLMKKKLLRLETLLAEEIIQQDQAIQKLASALRRSFLLIGKRKKPLASFLFLGPTGVGKTQTAKSVASIFFSEKTTSAKNNLIRFDMSQYQTKGDIEKLIGSMDTGNPGQFTTAIREQPYGVLLLDEIEKADNDLLNILLTVLDEGYFTDGYGKRVDCKNLLIIATSNSAAGEIYLHQQNNFNLIEYLIENRLYTPEFLNRFDDVIVFKPLTESSIALIANKIIDEFAKEIYQSHTVKLIVSPPFIEQLIKEHYNAKFGARNMERAIRESIEDRVAKALLEGKIKSGDIFRLD